MKKFFIALITTILIINAKLVSAENNASLSLNGGQSVSISDSVQNGLDITGDFTLQMWVKLSSSNGADFFYTHYEGPTNFTNFYINHDNNHLNFSSIDNNVWGISIYTIWTPQINTWYHIAVTGKGGGDGTESDWGIYVNGVEQTIVKEVGSWNPTLANHGGSIYIGQQGNGSNYLDGSIDEISIWNIVKTDLATSYNDEFDGSESGIVACWRFENTYADLVNSNTLSSGGSFSSDAPSTESGDTVVVDPPEEPTGECPCVDPFADVESARIMGTSDWQRVAVGKNYDGIITVCIFQALARTYVKSYEITGLSSDWDSNNINPLDGERIISLTAYNETTSEYCIVQINTQTDVVNIYDFLNE